MNRLVAKAIVLKRINYGESDRIVTFLTQENGKISALAKAVRKPSSKLAGGIELLSENEVTLLQGRGELQTLISSRLIEHFNAIASSMNHLKSAYDIITIVNKVAEYNSDPDLYDLLKSSFKALSHHFDDKLVRLWFYIRLLKILGHSPNLKTDSEKSPLDIKTKYNFFPDDMTFHKSSSGIYNSNHIKLLRLCISQSAEKISKLEGVEPLVKPTFNLVESALEFWL